MEYFLPKMLQTLRTDIENWFKLKNWDQNFWNILSFVCQEEY